MALPPGPGFDPAPRQPPGSIPPSVDHRSPQTRLHLPASCHLRTARANCLLPPSLLLHLSLLRFPLSLPPRPATLHPGLLRPGLPLPPHCPAPRTPPPALPLGPLRGGGRAGPTPRGGSGRGGTWEGDVQGPPGRLRGLAPSPESGAAGGTHSDRLDQTRSCWRDVSRLLLSPSSSPPSFL